MDFDGKYGNQCVDLFRFYLRDVLNVPQPGGVRGAKDLAKNYDPKNFRWVKNVKGDGKVPNPGDIVIWDGDFGHVGVAIEANPKANYFYSFDINFPQQGYLDDKGNFIGTGVAHKQKHLWTEAILGWLQPLKNDKPINTQPPTSDMVCHTKEKNEELITKATWYDNNFDRVEDLKNVKIEHEQFEKTINHRLETLAQNLGTINDWDEVVNASARFKSLDEKNLELQDKLDREIQAHKATVLDYQNKLQILKDEMVELKKNQAKELELLQTQHSKEIDTISARVDKEINELEKAKQEYEVTNKFIGWIKKLFKKGE
jgi:hypothetical protein